MRLIIVDRGKEFCDAASWQFRSHPEVQIVCGRFEDVPSFDCVVAAGNSFGLMDAGMDLAVVRFFGRHVHTLHFHWERSSPAERSLDMREAERAALSAPTIFSRA